MKLAPLLTLPDINPLSQSTITSLTSMVLYLELDLGESSMTNGIEETDDLSSTKACVNLPCIPLSFKPTFQS